MSHPAVPEHNFTAVLDPTVTPDPDAPAVIDWATDEEIPYDTLAERVTRAGSALRDLGATPGDRICLFFPNEAAYLDAFFGAMRIGAVPVPVNVKLARGTIADVVRDSGATLAVTSDDPAVRGTALSVASADGTPIETVAVAGDDPTLDRPEGPLSVHAFASLVAAAEPGIEPAPVATDDPAMQPYTSGSTGRPKGVVLTHGGIRWNTDAIAKAWMLDGRDRGIAATPLYHKNAMPGLKALLDVGGSVVIMPGFEADDVLAAIERHGITFITGVPAMFKLLLEEAAAGDYDCSSLEFAVCGSAPVSEELFDRFGERFDAPLLEAYGLTEGGPVVSMSPRWGVNKVGCTGPALPGVETVVVDPETAETVPPGAVGELLVSNPGLGRYHDRPEENERSFDTRDGRTFLRTGDLASKDEDGYHSIVGRLDDMMIVGGENVYPTEVENLLLAHPAVRDVSVVAAPHAVKGEAPVAFVVGDGITEEDLRTYAIENGPAYAHPRRVFFLDALPLTGTEKIDRQRLEAMAAERIDGPL